MVTLATGLVQRGHAVECLTYFPGFTFFREEIARSGVTIHDVVKRGRVGANVILAIRDVLRSASFDAVLAFMETPSLYAEMAALGLPVRVVVSERVEPPVRADARQYLRAFTHQFADAIVTNSRTSLAAWSARFPRLQHKLHCIFNGVDLSHFIPTPIPDMDRELRLVAIGTIVDRKNALGLARGLVDLRHRGAVVPSISWVGKEESGTRGKDYRNAVDQLLKQEGLESCWKWCGESKDIRPYLADAHGLIHPSFREGLANAICEAFAMGRPVLASGVGDNRWLIGNDQRGLTFEPSQPTSIADAIYRYVTLDTASRNLLGGNARAFAEESLGAVRYVDEYVSLLGGKGP